MAVTKEAAMTAHHTALYTDHLTTLHLALAHVTTWQDSPRKRALVEQYEQEIADCIACQALADEMAEVSEEEVELSEELEAAIIDAQAVGCAVVADAAALLSEMARLVPGCVALRGAVTVAAVEIEGGELRLVRRAGSTSGAMSWRAA